MGPGVERETTQNGCRSIPWRRKRICVSSGTKLACWVASAMASSWVTSWLELREMTKASIRTATTTAARGQLGARRLGRLGL